MCNWAFYFANCIGRALRRQGKRREEEAGRGMHKMVASMLNRPGKDFLLLNAGDPIFLTFDGKDIVHQGSACYPFFINEVECL